MGGRAFQHRSGRVISFGRLALGSVFLLAIYLDPSQPSRFAGEAYAILAAYALLSACYLAFTWNDWWLENRLALPAHIFDIAVFTLLVFLTEGYTSPFFTFFVFIILSATIRWGWRETAVTAAALIPLFFAAGLAAFSWADGEFELVRFIVRGTYLIVLSLLLIWFGVNQPSRRLIHGASLQLVDRDNPGEPPIRAAMEQAAARTGARRIVFAWWEREEPWINAAVLDGDGFHTKVHGPDSFGPPVEETLGGEVFLFDQARRRILCRGAGARRLGGPAGPVDPAFAKAFAIDEGLSIPVESDLHQGVLFALGIPGMSSDDLAIGERLRTEISAALERACVISLSEEAAAGRTRLALARDLHDSVVQLLVGASFRLEGMRKALAGGESVDSDIADLQHELSLEKQELRGFIGALRDGGRRAAQRGLCEDLRGLAARLTRQWGIACDLARCPEGLAVSPGLRHDIHQLLREAVANAVRHGGATGVSISVDSGAGGVSIVVADNGRGFAGGGGGGSEVRKPRSLDERVRALGGDLSLESGERGSRIAMKLPLGGKA